MIKHFSNNSVMRRASQFENSNHEQTKNEEENSIKDYQSKQNGQTRTKSFIVAFDRFQQEFATLYPNFEPPFKEVTCLNQAKNLLELQRERITQLTKEMHMAKFAANFLETIITYNERDFEKNTTICENENKQNESDISEDNSGQKEQYVTVITLNDSTYGEIQRQKISPNTSLNQEKCEKSIVEAKSLENNDKSTKDKTEPIYLNTLESQKASEKVPKKRPPTPPRKPKFNKLQGSSGDIFGSVCSQSNQLSKSDSLTSISQIQRKFNGPMQQINREDQVTKKENNKDVNKETVTSYTLPNSTENSNSKNNYLRTFSLEPQKPNSKTSTQSDKESGETSLYHDYDNIYDTVAPDSDCDIFDDKTRSLKDDDLDTSSQDILSRSSSTDEGLSNYVNIDYFLRKDSLGRSNSNVPARLSKKSFHETEEGDEHEDNETNVSSIKSSDYDHFSSNENLLSSLQQQSTSLRSFNSVSTNSSTSGSSLRTRNVKTVTHDMSASYPPNLSTFTPPIRDKNQNVFFKEGPLNEGEEKSFCSNGSELNLSNSSKNASLDKSTESSTVDFYAYTDILDSLPLNESKTEPIEEPVQLETKSFTNFRETILEDDNYTAKYEMENTRQMRLKIVKSIIESETIYLDCLNTLIQYKKALNSTTSTKENALLSVEDLNTIFYRIPDLHQIHNTFLIGLKNTEEHGLIFKNSSLSSDPKLTSKHISKHSIGELFLNLAENLYIYSDYIRNYSNAIDTANRCSANNAKFSEIIMSIKIISKHKLEQFTNLVDLLHKPIARLQKNALVLHDLIKFSDEEEQKLLKDAEKLTQNFLKDLNLDKMRSFFPAQDKFRRRLVKESFIIESGDKRKLRHLFLFNDVILCAKYKASSKQKFTFELKWFQMLNDIVLHPDQEPFSQSSSNSQHTLTHSSSTLQNNSNLKEFRDGIMANNSITNLKMKASSLRYDLLVVEKSKGSIKIADKLKKKISEMESLLVLFLPQLKFSFHIRNNTNKNYTFYLSSEYERNCWYDAIKRMQLNVMANTEKASLYELQCWIESCRKSINPNLGSFLLRTNKDETLRYGDLFLRIKHLNNTNHKLNMFVVVETDSYGHYFKQAVTKYLKNLPIDNINQEFLLVLEGTQSLRFLLYEDTQWDSSILLESNNSSSIDVNEKTSIIKGKTVIELSSSYVSKEFKYREIPIHEYTLCIEMSFVSWSSIMEKIPPNKIYGAFGVSVTKVCKHEKSKVPLLILACINEVQRRGLKEVGIYRLSGLSSDVQKLKKTFETNPREACWLIREIDIHTVSGLLKLYLRELPESLFTNDMYQKYFEARDLKNQDEKDLKMTSLLSQLIEPNQSTIIALIEHLVLVNRYEEYNKMSLNNLATIFGPTMLRTNSSSGSHANSKHSSSAAGSGNSSSTSSNISSSVASMVINTDLFTASTVDVMAQADILYFFLRRKSEGFSLTSIDHEETCL